jgi:hypothetical protein
MSKKIFWVDIPDKDTVIQDYDSAWINLKTFNTREEAVDWIRENIGYCDDEGRINLITEGEEI